MKLRVLVDNNTFTDHYFSGEPALSYYLEIDDKKILFDAGYSDAFLNNAALMNIDLSLISHLVISHGHNDHTNGLKHLAADFNPGSIEFIAHPLCFQPKYDHNQYIGAPFSEKEISRRFQYRPSAQPLNISDNCLFLGEIPSLNDFETRRAIGRTLIEGEEADDLLSDDSALVCTTAEGLFIITGCSHSGLCNIVEYARQICRNNKIAGIIGGFHLFETDARLRRTIEYLTAVAAQRLYPGHCVSLKVKAEMMKHLNVGEVGVGLSLSL